MRARLAPESFFFFFFLAPGPAVIYGFVLLLIFVHAPSICNKTFDTLTLLTLYYFHFISFALFKVTYLPSPPPSSKHSFMAFIWTFSYIQATLNGDGGGGGLSTSKSVVDTGVLFYK